MENFQPISSKTNSDRQKFNENRKEVKKSLKHLLLNKFSDDNDILLLLLILLIPFGSTIAMYIYEGGWTKRVTVNLLLSFLCIAGVIHALIVIFGKK